MNAADGTGVAAPQTHPGFGAELQVGQVLDGRFKIVRVIDRGGMAEIYEALDLDTSKPVALKVPLLQLEADRDFLARFQREESIGLTLDHPCILKFVWAGTRKSRPYLVTELLHGQTLAARLLRESRLAETEASRVASQICDGLDYLHRKGIVHRDLKPDNIMLCKDGAIRIIDFGIAKSKHARRLTFHGPRDWMGSPDYISPEQVRGERGTPRSDIYAVGTMLYAMTTGGVPFEDDNPLVALGARVNNDPEPPRQRHPQLSPQIEEIILHALERDPADRYRAASLMKADLDHLDQVTLTERFKRSRPFQRWKSRLPILLTAAALLSALILILLFLLRHS